ncbi:uncharacterized protein [Anabrus simplex]|uniref:uncharacterized protein isoform X2 n=1 Tax=Anabrus simplex TaxID=316456 RepID=UPI0035A37F35
MAGKEEVEQILSNHIAELERSSQDAIENSKHLKQENIQLSLKIVKAKELLKKLKAERDEARLKCKSLEEEQDQLTSEKLAGERLVEQLRTEIQNLQHKITLNVDPVSTLNSENQFAASLNSSEPNNLPSNDKGSGEDYSLKKLNVTGDSSPLNLLKWMEQCNNLEHEKKELVMECELLKTSLEERKIHEKLFNEDMMAAQSRCEKLEKRLIELEKCESTIEKLIQAKVEMEFKLQKLESENKVLEDIEANLSAQQVETKLEYEKKLQQCLQDQLLKGNNDEKIETLILELSCKSKDLIVVKEQLTSSEYQIQKLNNRINALEKSNANVMKQFELFHDEVAKMRGRLEEAWQEHEGTEKELGHARKELVLLQLRQSQLETSQSRLLDSSCDMSERSILSLQQEVHQMVEDLVAEVAALKQALQAERCRSEQLSCELKDGGLLELQQKLELVLQSNKELLSEKEVLMEKLQRGEHSSDLEGVLDSQQNELMVQLAAYREQHTSLAEILGSAGILQETVRRQKEELMLKLQEKLEIEQSLEAERAVLKQTQLKLQLLEQQMIEKDNIQVELQRQKTVLEASLHDIEDRLRDQVDCLHSQKLELEAQIRSRDIHIRKCKLQVRAKEIEMDVGNLSQLDVNETAGLNVKKGEEVSQKMLEVLRMELDEAHSKALARLRQHLNEQFSIRETVLQEKFTSELQAQHAVHQEQWHFFL